MAMGLNKQIQFVRQPKPTDGEIIAQVAVFDGEGNPVDVGGAPTADTLAGATNTGKFCSNCGAAHIYHTVCGECRYYRGKLAIEKLATV